MSDTVVLGLIGAALAFLTLLVQTATTLILKRMDRKQEATAVKVETVKATLAATTTATDAKLGEIHKLVNGQHGITLQTGVTSARALYKAEPTDESRLLMEVAASELAKHEEREAMIRADKDKRLMYTHNSYVVK